VREYTTLPLSLRVRSAQDSFEVFGTSIHRGGSSREQGRLRRASILTWIKPLSLTTRNDCCRVDS
jgi:hypothetical protein